MFAFIDVMTTISAFHTTIDQTSIGLVEGLSTSFLLSMPNQMNMSIETTSIRFDIELFSSTVDPTSIGPFEGLSIFRFLSTRN